MNKKWIAMGGAIGIGSAMLVTSGFAASASYAGYDTFKGAVKQTKTADSVSGKLQVSISDNGTKVLSLESTFKKNQEKDAASAVVQLNSGSQTHAFNIYHQEDKTIIKSGDSEIYRVMEHQDSRWKKHHGEHAEMAKEFENVVDALVGNIRSNVALENQSNGSKHVSLHLAGNQIPEVVNALGSFIIKKASNHHHGEKSWHLDDNGPFAASDLKLQLPKLTDNIRVEEVNLDATINTENYIEQKTAEIKIAGKDAVGVEHKLTVELEADFSEWNKTTPDTVDLSGKQVQTIERKFGKHHAH